MSFIEFLISKGYKSFRKVYQNKQWIYIEENDNLNYFSSSIGGYIDLRLIKNNKEIIFGLHEYKHHPTLIYPNLGCSFDKDIDRLFEKYSYEEILEMIEK